VPPAALRPRSLDRRKQRCHAVIMIPVCWHSGSRAEVHPAAPCEVQRAVPETGRCCGGGLICTHGFQTCPIGAAGACVRLCSAGGAGVARERRGLFTLSASCAAPETQAACRPRRRARPSASAPPLASPGLAEAPRGRRSTRAAASAMGALAQPAEPLASFASQVLTVTLYGPASPWA